MSPFSAEQDLLTKIASGDQNAFSTLYYMHVKHLQYYIRRTAGSPFLVDDIVHDVFIKVWESRKIIDPQRPFKPYLFTLAKRSMLNMLKRAQHEQSILIEIRKYMITEENTTDLRIDFNESNALVSEAIDSLNGQCKEVFIRCRIKGLSYKQTASELSITESTVNKHMNRAIQLIRTYIRLKNGMSLLLACISLME